MRKIRIVAVVVVAMAFAGGAAVGAWLRNGFSAEASWRLVHFIRHLPKITFAEEVEQMEALDPKSPEEIRQEIEEERFLQGGGDTPPIPSITHEHTGGR